MLLYLVLPGPTEGTGGTSGSTGRRATFAECSKDADCPDGKTCDPRTKVCVDVTEVPSNQLHYGDQGVEMETFDGDSLSCSSRHTALPQIQLPGGNGGNSWWHKSWFRPSKFRPDVPTTPLPNPNAGTKTDGTGGTSVKVLVLVLV